METSAKPLLKGIYDVLVFNEIVRTSAEFASTLDYNAGHISTLMRSNDVLPKGVINALNKKYGISKEYLISNGKEGEMFIQKDNDSNKQNNNINEHVTFQKENVDLDPIKPGGTMNEKLLEILDRVTRTDERHAKNYAELIAEVRTEKSKRKKEAQAG